MRFQYIGQLPEFKETFSYMGSGYCYGSQAPVLFYNSGILMVYFSARDTQGRSRPFYYELNPDNPLDVLSSGNVEIPLGNLGEPDSDGTMMSQVFNNMYLYTGWNKGEGKVRYRTACMAYLKVDRRKIVTYDRTTLGLCGSSMEFRSSGLNLFMADQFWQDNPYNPGFYEPFYNIAVECNEGSYVVYSDIEVALDEKTGGVAKPWVITLNQRDHLFYCKRGRWNYRTDKDESYKIYVKKEYYNKDSVEELVEIKGAPESLMQAYPALVTIDNKTYMFYNTDFRSSISVCLLIDQ